MSVSVVTAVRVTGQCSGLVAEGVSIRHVRCERVVYLSPDSNENG